MRKTWWAAVWVMLVVVPVAYAQSDFTVTKSVGPSSPPALAGNDMQFDVTVINNGPASGAVTLNDAVPAGMTFVSVSAPAGFSCTTPAVGASSGTVSCTAANMAVGSASFTIVFEIPSNTPSNTSFTNTATVSSPTDTDGSNNSASVTFSTPASSDLSIIKTGPSTADNDTDVTFNIAITNNGPDPAGGVALKDIVAGGWSFVSLTADPNFSCSDPGAGATSGSVDCSANTLAAGGTANFTITFHIPANAAPGTTFTNTATVSSATDPDTENNSSSAQTTTPPPPVADVTITKTGPTAAPPDTDVTYTITVTNLGPSTGQNVMWTDTLPNSVPPGSQMTFVSLTQTSGPTFTCTTGATVSCSIAMLGAGTSATWDLVAHIPSGTPSGRSYSNVANLTSDNDPNSENNIGSTALVVEAADVGVNKSAPLTAIAGGPTFDYIVTLSNSGPDAATDAAFTDVLPAGILFVSLTQDTGPAASCIQPGNGTNGTVACTISVLGNGQSAQFTITVQAAPGVANGTVVNNTATASTSSADTNSNNDSFSASTTISAQADVAIVKSGPASVTAGNNITYGITVTNNGPSNAASVSWTDTLPAGTTFVSETQDTGPAFTCTTGATISCNIATLGAGATATFTIVASVSPSATGTLSNTANVTTTTPDNASGNNSSNVNTTVNAQADVAIVKNGPPAAAAGSNIGYTITVSNNGPSTASNVSWTDTLPANTTFVSETQNTGPAFTCTTGATVTCSIATLAPAATATFTLVVQVSPSAVNGSTITNTATVTTTTTDNTPGNNSSMTSATVAATADLAVTKNGPSSTPSNTTIVYDISVTNHGPADAANATLTDTLPTGTTFVSINQTSGPTFTCSGTGPVTCTIATFPSGATASFQLTLNVPPSAQSGSTLTNTATVSATTADSDPNNNTATATTNVGASIPAMSPLMLALLALMVSALALAALRR
jgi:large repetitive protein